MKLTRTIYKTTLTLGTIGALGTLAADPASAVGFGGEYDPSNWDLTNNNADGFVDTSNAPSSITLTGGDNGSGFFGQTSYTSAAAGDGLVNFDWSYNTQDVDGPSFDPFGYVVNNSFVQLTNDSGPNFQSDSASFNVTEGDIFGFAVQTDDNILGPASATISNFSAPKDVPEPTTTIGLLVLGTLGTGAALKRKVS